MKFELFSIKIDVPPGFLVLKISFSDGKGSDFKGGDVSVSMPYDETTTIGEAQKIAFEKAKQFLSDAVR
jgi:hypothetical protein